MDEEFQLKLGKLPARVDKRTIKLANILRVELLPPLPTEYDAWAALSIVDNNMFANDQYGDCVKAARAHQTLRFEMYEQKLLIAISDQDVISEYFEETGGFDSGLEMLGSLNDWRQNGWEAGGKTYTIHAFASVDYHDYEEVEYCIYLLNGAQTGMVLPYDAWVQAMAAFRAGDVWDISNVNATTGTLYGHAIDVGAYNAVGPVCITWAKIQQMTWSFWDKYIDESYGIVDNRDEWVGDSPVDVEKLDAYLKEITQPQPTPSDCKMGTTATRIVNRLLKASGRRGRLYYLNP